MSAKHTLGANLEMHLSNEDNANGISETIHDEFGSLQDQRLLRKFEVAFEIQHIAWYQLTLICSGCCLY